PPLFRSDGLNRARNAEKSLDAGQGGHVSLKAGMEPRRLGSGNVCREDPAGAGARGVQAFFGLDLAFARGLAAAFGAAALRNSATVVPFWPQLSSSTSSMTT